MGALVGCVIPEAQLLLRDAVRNVPREPRRFPLLVEARRVLRPGEVLKLHLLELARAEDEVARSDLVAERLADLRDAERQAPAGGLLNVLEVHEDCLSGLRAKPGDRCRVLHGTDERLEHEVEATRIRELLLAAVRAADARQIERARAPGGRERVAVGQLVKAEALAAVAALDERIGEVLDVTGRLPDARMHEDRAVEPDDVVAELHHRAPPGLFHVVLELDAERPEVPRRAGAAVDLARREDEPSPLGERGDLVADVPVHLRPAAGKLAERGTRLHDTRAGRGRSRTSSRSRVLEMSRSST